MDFSVTDVNKILGNIKNRESLINQFQTFKNISLDSRTILNYDLFIAIKGINFDGHDFLKEVIKKGGKAVVIEEGMQNLFCLLYTSPSPRDLSTSRMPSSA